MVGAENRGEIQVYGFVQVQLIAQMPTPVTRNAAFEFKAMVVDQVLRINWDPHAAQIVRGGDQNAAS